MNNTIVNALRHLCNHIARMKSLSYFASIFIGLLTCEAYVMAATLSNVGQIPDKRDFLNDIIFKEAPLIDHMPSRCVLKLFQDSQGEMWYATKDGLSRDNGHSIRVYYPTEISGLNVEGNQVQCIGEDATGHIWFGTRQGAFILDKHTQAVVPVRTKSVFGHAVNQLKRSSDGKMWVGVNGALFCYGPDGNLEKSYQVTWNNKPVSVTSMCEDSKNNMWLTLNGGGICRIDRNREMLKYYPWPFDVHASSIIEDNSGKFFWVGTWLKGIVRFDPSAHPDRMFEIQHNGKFKDERDGAVVTMALDDKKGYLWTVTVSGLKVYEVKGTRLEARNESLPEAMRYQMLTDLVKDNEGNIWVGGFNVPSFVISFRPSISRMPLKTVKQMSGHDATISHLCVDDDPDLLWIYQERHRLYLYDLRTGNLESDVLASFAKTNHNIGAISILHKAKSQKGIWASCQYPSEIYLLRHNGNKLYVADKIDFSRRPAPRSIYEDDNGGLWIGTSKNLYLYDTKSKKLSLIADKTGSIVDIIGDRKGGVLVVERRDVGHTIVSKYCRRKLERKQNIPIECSLATKDAENNLWLGTRTGELYRYSPDNKLTDISEYSDYSPNGSIGGLFTDSRNNIWVVTEQRITKIDPGSLELHNYYVNDSQIDVFNIFPHSYAILKSGKIVFGGTGGLCALDETKMSLGQTSQNRPLIVNISEIKVDGKITAIPMNGKKLILDPNVGSLEVEFSCNRHLDAERITYAYRLGDADGKWIKLPSGVNKVVISNLNRGDQKLQLRRVTGDNMNEQGNVTVLDIYRKPAFYETAWFIILVTLLVVGVTVFVIYKAEKAKSFEHQKKLEEELTQTKLRFFTNITHELRTPLTLISTPLDSLISRCEGKNREQLIRIRRNARLLTDLINDLLNFRRIEMGGEKLNPSKGDIVETVRGIAEEFNPLANEKKIDFTFMTDTEHRIMSFDISKLRVIIHNLLHNAFKFSKAGDAVSLSLSFSDASISATSSDTGSNDVKGNSNNMEKGKVTICVKDTGAGIEESQLPHIFQRFYQVTGADKNTGTQGSGIGLHLVSEYVKLFGGDITVNSKLGQGTEFIVTFPDLSPQEMPVADIHPESAELSGQTPSEEDGDTGNPDIKESEKNHKLILVVDDNDEFRDFMRTELSEYYNICVASNADEALEIALKEHPDIIITDVMMPGRDGYQLCADIKNNVDTSDIPVIFLTARGCYDAERNAYESLGDAFVQKPFNLSMLLSRINNLIEQKTRRQKRYKESPEADIKELEISPLDSEILQKILTHIDRNITNSEYGVAELSSDIGMSRMNLYRKIVSITGQTPSNFIKSARLKKAAQMLLAREKTIVEIGYAVGFASPSYFTRAFKSEFGITPSQYQKNNCEKC